MTPDQLSFNLPQRPAMDRDAFFVAPSNAEAVRLIEHADLWPGGKLLLLGPEGSGKTHLVHVWAQQTGARIVAAQRLARADIPVLAAGPVAVEDAHLLAGRDAEQTALFHLYNLLTAQGQPLLLTARGPVPGWQLSLRDLASRLGSVAATRLRQPDDALLGAVLTKLFADRQLRPAPDTVPYLVRRIDRSFEAARAVVRRMDRAALDSGREINRALARDLLALSGDQ